MAKFKIGDRVRYKSEHELENYYGTMVIRDISPLDADYVADCINNSNRIYWIQEEEIMLENIYFKLQTFKKQMDNL